MAPILSGVAGQASSMVSTAIVSGTLGAMSVIRGGFAGTAAGAKDVQDSGVSLRSRAGLAGVFGGMGRGVGMGVGSAMMSDTSVGVSQMGPGSGSVGSPFAKQAVRCWTMQVIAVMMMMMMIVIVEKEREEAEDLQLRELR